MLGGTGGNWDLAGGLSAPSPRSAPLASLLAPTGSPQPPPPILVGSVPPDTALPRRGAGGAQGGGGSLLAAGVQPPAPPRHAAAAGTFIEGGQRGAGERGGVLPPPRPPAPQQTPASRAPRSPSSESPAAGGAEAGPAPWQGWGVLGGWGEGCGEGWGGTGGPKAGRQQEGSGEAGVPRRDSVEAQPSQIPGGGEMPNQPPPTPSPSLPPAHPVAPPAPPSPWDPRASSESVSRSIPAGEGRWRGGGWHQHGPSPPMTWPPHKRVSPANRVPPATGHPATRDTGTTPRGGWGWPHVPPRGPAGCWSGCREPRGTLSWGGNTPPRGLTLLRLVGLGWDIHDRTCGGQGSAPSGLGAGTPTPGGASGPPQHSPSTHRRGRPGRSCCRGSRGWRSRCPQSRA